MSSGMSDDFLRRYTSVQQSLFAYIRSTGFTLTDAEDILQDVAVASCGRSAADDRPTEEVAFYYNKIAFNYSMTRE